VAFAKARTWRTSGRSAGRIKRQRIVAGDLGEAADTGWKQWRYSEQDIGSGVVIGACVQDCASGRLVHRSWQQTKASRKFQLSLEVFIVCVTLQKREAWKGNTTTNKSDIIERVAELLEECCRKVYFKSFVK